MANDGLLFRAFGIVNKRTKTPLFGEIFFGIFAASLAIIFNVEILVEFLSVGTLLAYTIVAGSSIILHYQSRVTVYDRQRMKHLAIESYDTPEDEAEAGKLKERFRWLACLPSPYEGLFVITSENNERVYSFGPCYNKMYDARHLMNLSNN